MSVSRQRLLELESEKKRTSLRESSLRRWSSRCCLNPNEYETREDAIRKVDESDNFAGSQRSREVWDANLYRFKEDQ